MIISCITVDLGVFGASIMFVTILGSVGGYKTETSFVSDTDHPDTQ